MGVEDEWLTVAEVAEAAGVTVSAVRRWVEERRIASEVRLGRRLIAAEELQRFLAAPAKKRGPKARSGQAGAEEGIEPQHSFMKMKRMLAEGVAYLEEIQDRDWLAAKEEVARRRARVVEGEDAE